MKTLLSILTLSSLLLTACSKGFELQSASTSINGSNNGQNDSSGGGTNPTVPTWDKINVDGFASGGSYSGQLVIYIDKAKQSLLLVLPIPTLVPILSPIEFSDAPGVFLTTHKKADGSSSMAVSIPLHYVVRGGAFMGGQKLPNGDPLPFVPAGELPGFGIQFPQMPDYRVHVYIGVNVAAAYVELPDFGLPIGGIFPVKNKNKTKVVGAIGYVLPKNNSAGGMYLAAQIPDEMSRLIDELIRW